MMSATTKKLVTMAALLVTAGAAAAVTWIGPRNLIGMLRYDTRQEGHLKVGDLAPDVELVALDGARREKLSSLVGDRPLVLVFGSFT